MSGFQLFIYLLILSLALGGGSVKNVQALLENT